MPPRLASTASLLSLHIAAAAMANVSHGTRSKLPLPHAGTVSRSCSPQPRASRCTRAWATARQRVSRFTFRSRIAAVKMERVPFQATRAAVSYEGMRPLPVTVLLDNVRSMYNVGAFFRTADAAGVEKLLLCGITAYPPKPGITKTALGAEERVRWEHSWDGARTVR